MPRESEIEKLFQSFIDNTLTKEEYSILMEYIQDVALKKKWEEMIDRHLFENHSLAEIKAGKNDAFANALYEKVNTRLKDYIDDDKIVHRSFFTKRNLGWLAAAASIILAVGLFFSHQVKVLPKNPSITNTSTPFDSLAITLRQGNGKVAVVTSEGKQAIIDAKGNVVGQQNGSQISYKNTETLKELVYNELRIPYGKQFALVLSDGTKVNLNAGSSLRYPVQFIEGKQRKVFLSGEAYFDVTKDKKHPFIVNANEVNVQVLGTEFNVSFYPEDSHINTVLVEGAVSLYEESKENNESEYVSLTPGNMASWDKEQRDIAIKKVDVTIYTAWKEGRLLFRATPFNSIRKKLERHFNVVIENQYPLLETQVYSASFKEESIEEILNAFKEDTPFEYKMENNKIILIKNTQLN